MLRTRTQTAFGLALLAALSGGLAQSKAATFNKAPLSPTSDIIFVDGELEFGDEKKFLGIALQSDNAVVVFQSPGGNLNAGMEIGKVIHLKGFSTYVADDIQCASACALAWLGGRARFMSDTSRIGFHAIYIKRDGQPTVSAAGNALVGAYVSQLGLSTAAVIYVTSAPPDGMKWLNAADAARVGIHVTTANLSDKSKSMADAETATPKNVSPTEAVTLRTEEFVAATNQPDEKALTYLGRTYAPQLQYFGKTSTRQSVLSEKATFFRRWPSRDYSVKKDSLQSKCESNSPCVVTGILSWSVSSTEKNSTGTASFSLTWQLNGDDWQIVSESSRVLNRQVLPVSGSDDIKAVKYVLDPSSTRVVSMSNLYPDCYASPTSTQGKIVKRQFATDGLKFTGFVIEASDGSRDFINVDVSIDNEPMVRRDWIMRGLQTLLAEGRTAEIKVRMCGAAGRVVFLDAAR